MFRLNNLFNIDLFWCVPLSLNEARRLFEISMKWTRIKNWGKFVRFFFRFVFYFEHEICKLVTHPKIQDDYKENTNRSKWREKKVNKKHSILAFQSFDINEYFIISYWCFDAFLKFWLAFDWNRWFLSISVRSVNWSKYWESKRNEYQIRLWKQMETKRIGKKIVIQELIFNVAWKN